jgi:hypothetical protein
MHCAYAILAFVACPAVEYFSTLSHKGHDLKKKLLNIKCVLIFFRTLAETFCIVRRNERDMTKVYIDLHLKYPFFRYDFNET